MRLSLEIITSQKDFLRLEDVWNSLNLLSEDPLVFNTFEWQFNCFKHFKKNSKLNIFLVYDGQELLCIAPLVISNVFKTPLKKIEFIGNNVSDMLDFIIKKGYEKKTIDFLKSYLLKNRKDWDLIDLYPLHEKSHILKEFSFDCKDTSFLKEEIDTSPAIILPSNYEKYFSSLSKKFRFNLRYCLRTLEKKYKVHFGKIEKAEDVKWGMEGLFRLHHTRWRSKKLPGVLVGSTRKRFHMKVAQDLFGKSLSLYYLSVDGKVISVLYGFVFLDRFYFYLSGFSPEFSRYSPGNLLINFCIQDAISSGIKKFEFLKGREEYKYRFGAQDFSLWRVSIGWSNYRSKILHLINNAEKKLIKTIKEKFI